MPPSKQKEHTRSALLVAVGSRGDTEPLFALATAMLNSNNFTHIHICIQPDYTHLLPDDPRITAHEFSFRAKDFSTIYYCEYFKNALLSFFTRNFDPTQISRNTISTVITRFVVPALPFIYRIACQHTPSVLLATTLAAPSLFTVAEHLRIPMWLVNYQPTTPTAIYPYYMSDIQTAVYTGKAVARMHGQSCQPSQQSEQEEHVTSYAIQQNMHERSLVGINSFRNSLGLSSIDMSHITALVSGQVQHVRVLNAYSEQLVPRSPDWSPNIHQVSALAQDHFPTGWSPTEKCPQLVKYLAMGDRPLCVSFGSMNVAEKKSFVTRELFRGLRAAGVNRIILLKGEADLGVHNLSSRDSELKKWADKHVFISNEAPQFAWLLPKCSGLVCHGGAGTTFAGLHAGIPVVIVPLFCDQFFWGQVVEDLGLGNVAGPSLREATADSYAKAITRALTTEVIERAAMYGQTERRIQSASITAAHLVACVS